MMRSSSSSRTTRMFDVTTTATIIIITLALLSSTATAAFQHDKSRFLEDPGYAYADDAVFDDDAFFSDFLEFGSCTTLPFSDDDEGSNPKYAVTFYSKNQCSAAGVRQTHVVDLEIYLDAVLKQRFSYQDVECSTCYNKCPRTNRRHLEQEEENEDDALPGTDAGIDGFCSQCMYKCTALEDGMYDAAEFISCQRITFNNGCVMFAGPYCTSDGYQIKIGVFADDQCTDFVSDVESSLEEEGSFAAYWGDVISKLSYKILRTTYQGSCTSCASAVDTYSEYIFDYLGGVDRSGLIRESQDMCSALFEGAWEYENNREPQDYDDLVNLEETAIQLEKCNTESVPISVASSRSGNTMWTSKHYATIGVKSYCDVEDGEGGWAQRRKLEEPIGYADTFVVDLETYLEHIVRYRKVVRERKCNQCAMSCNANGSEFDDAFRRLDEYEAEEEEDIENEDYEEEMYEFENEFEVFCDWCEEECESKSPPADEELTNFIKCGVIYSPDNGSGASPLYAGPVCGEGGSTIEIAIFTDKDCTMMDSTKHPEDYLLVDDITPFEYSSPLLDTTFGDTSCTSCVGSDVYYPGLHANDRITDAQTMCTSLIASGEQFELDLAKTPAPSVVVEDNDNVKSTTTLSPSASASPWQAPSAPSAAAKSTNTAAACLLLCTAAVAMIWY